MSDIWIRKIKTYFRRFDFDNDGVIHRKEFHLIVERFGDLEKCDPAIKEKARELLDDIFSRYTKASGGKDVLTEDVLIESMKMQRDNPEMKKSISDMVLGLFSAMDVNNDGYLDFEEYRRAYENLGLIESDFIRAGFDEIDVNHDGRLNIEEYIQAFTDYLFSDDENTTSVFGLLG